MLRYDYNSFLRDIYKKNQQDAWNFFLSKCSVVLYLVARMLHPDIRCHIGLMFHHSIKLLTPYSLSQFSQAREAGSQLGLLQTPPKQNLYMLSHCKDNYDIVSV